MLSILAYKSRLQNHMTSTELNQLVRDARGKNEAVSVTGTLLFDGERFLQLLEGPESAVQAIYERVLKDTRHHQVVKLLQDYGPRRRFGQWGMRLLDLRDHPQGLVDKSLPGGLLRGINVLTNDRAFKIVQAFAAEHGKDPLSESSDPDHWHFVTRPSPFAEVEISTQPPEYCQFALQPIVNTKNGDVSSLEALIRSPTGGPPQDCFEGLSPEQRYEFDLASKAQAFKLASQINIGTCKLSINLLPMSLVRIPGAIPRLAGQIAQSGLKPQQIIVEITEEEAISHFDDFQAALKQLRILGMSVAIDDFGAGYAGLSLLSRFQPEKLKIDRLLITDIHRDWPRQAIVRAIIECCRALGITTVAEGVETPDEWCWLQAAGIDLFQGYLFARPKLNGTPDVAWPVRRHDKDMAHRPTP